MAPKAKNVEMFETEFVQRHFNAAIKHAQEEWLTGMVTVLRGNLLYCQLESPLEMAFLAWWQALSGSRSFDLDIKLQQEVQCGDDLFRVDFEAVPREDWRDTIERGIRYQLPLPRVAIELDGHEFHERTKDQVALRDRRDRALQANGWRVLHLSGSAFHKDPCEAVWRIYLDASGAFWDFRRRVFALIAEGH